MDIRDPKLAEVFAREKPDYVSHHAAQMDVRRSVAQPLFDADVNILGSINVIECAMKNQVKKFIYISIWHGMMYESINFKYCKYSYLIMQMLIVYISSVLSKIFYQ